MSAKIVEFPLKPQSRSVVDLSRKIFTDASQVVYEWAIQEAVKYLQAKDPARYADMLNDETHVAIAFVAKHILQQAAERLAIAENGLRDLAAKKKEDAP